MINKIILASKSGVRKQILNENGINCEVLPANIDEDHVKDSLIKEKATPEIISKNLAELKANKISQKKQNQIVLGADSVIDLKGELISKPINRNDAQAILEKLNGQKHQLISSVCISKNGSMIWNYTDASDLTMKQLNLDEIKSYLAKIKDKELYAYGVYQIEADGRSLFSKIEGDEDSIMGLPIKQMKKYLVIGNPITHSLSPKLHNHWIKENNIDAVYDKKQLNESDIKGIVDDIRNGKIDGANVTVPFKKSIIPFLDQLTPLAAEAQSVNTIFKKNNKIIGDNTDIGGFEKGLEHINYGVKNKKIFILGAGGVAPSIILALKKLGAAKIALSNRTKEKAENLKKIYSDLEIIVWGQNTDFDMIINATSVGLKKDDQIKLNFSNNKPNKLFYDVIYNPSKTNFLLEGEKLGNKIENGKMMFIYQAQLAFKIWHNILPKLNNKLLD